MLDKPFIYCVWERLSSLCVCLCFLIYVFLSETMHITLTLYCDVAFFVVFNLTHRFHVEIKTIPDIGWQPPTMQDGVKVLAHNHCCVEKQFLQMSMSDWKGVKWMSAFGKKSYAKFGTDCIPKRSESSRVKGHVRVKLMTASWFTLAHGHCGSSSDTWEEAYI